MERKKLIIVSPHGCIRVKKQAGTLKSLGYHITLVTTRDHKEGVFFDKVYTYKYENQLKDILGLFKEDVNSSIFHYHNEPTWPVVLIRTMYPDAIIVSDVHDSNYWRTDIKIGKKEINEYIHWDDEDMSMRCADAFVAPSPSCVAEIKGRLKKSKIKKPVVFLPSALPRDLYLYSSFNFSGGVVAQGGVTIPGMTKGDGWRDYTEFAKKIQGKRQLYIYSADISGNEKAPVESHYAKLDVKMGKYDYMRLLPALGSHTWNLVGNLVDAKVWKYALPNKFFDAMAACTPSVVLNCSEVSKLVQEYDIGITVNTVKELVKRWDEYLECRMNLLKYRDELCMENYIGNLTTLYKEIC